MIQNSKMLKGTMSDTVLVLLVHLKLECCNFLPVIQGTSPGSLTEMSYTDDIFIGGYNRLFVPNKYEIDTNIYRSIFMKYVILLFKQRFKNYSCIFRVIVIFAVMWYLKALMVVYKICNLTSTNGTSTKMRQLKGLFEGVLNRYVSLFSHLSLCLSPSHFLHTVKYIQMNLDACL